MTMKVEIGLANPPYQWPNKDNAGTKKFWNEFIKKSLGMLSDTGIMMFIVPADWLKIGYEEFDYLKQHLVSGRVLTPEECKKYFPRVGSTFSVLTLTKQHTGKTTIISGGQQTSIDLTGIHALPKDGNIHSISIFEKIRHEKKFEVIGGTTKKKLSSPQGAYRVVNGNGEKFSHQSLYQSETYTNWKVMIPEAQEFKYKWIDNNCDTGPAVFSIICDGEEEANKTLSLIDLKLYKFVMDRLKFSSRNNVSSVRMLPNVTSYNITTDKDLYDHFGLTQEEIDYIESTI